MRTLHTLFSAAGVAALCVAALSGEALAASALTLTGPTSAVVDRLQGWRERHGITYVVVPAGAADLMTPVLAQLAGG